MPHCSLIPTFIFQSYKYLTIYSIELVRDLNTSVVMANDEQDDEKASKVTPPSSQQNTPTEVGLTDWTSKNDPDDPHNWPFGKKAYHAGITAAFAFTTYVSCLLGPFSPFKTDSSTMWASIEPSCPPSMHQELIKSLNITESRQRYPC